MNLTAVYRDESSRHLSIKHLAGHDNDIAGKVSEISRASLWDNDAQFDRPKPIEYFAAHRYELKDIVSAETQRRFEK